MSITVVSKEALSEQDKRKIEYILKESMRPNESLANTFGERYKGRKDSNVLIDSTDIENGVKTVFNV